MKVRAEIMRFMLLSAVILMCVFCRNQNDIWKGSIQEENGVIVVKNPKKPIYGEDVFELKEELTIGEVEDNAGCVFSLIRDIAMDDAEMKRTGFSSKPMKKIQMDPDIYGMFLTRKEGI